LTFPGILVSFPTMQPGHLVEFYEEKRLLCAVVLELKGERLHVLTQTGRELTIAPKRILHACPSPLTPAMSRQQLLLYLEGTAGKRQNLKAAIDLEELWELLVQENQDLTVQEMAELWFGDPNPDAVAAMGMVLRDDRLLFKEKDRRWVPNPPEVVAQLQEQRQRELDRRRELEEAAAWLQALWEGRQAAAPESQAQLLDLLRQMAVLGPEGPDWPQGKAYLEKAGLNPQEAPFRLLVRLGVFSEDENLDFYRLEIPREFSPGALDQSRRLSRERFPDPFAARREDLRELEAFTIDGERTRDFDDAITLEEDTGGWRLGIHIADVASLVAAQSPLDLDAQERGTSIYLPEQRLAMLPEEISEGILSLLATQERFALSFLVTLSDVGEVQDWTICPSLIKVRRRFTYQEVDQLLPRDRTLAALARLTSLLRERRLAQGAYELRLPEVWVIFPAQGDLQVAVEDQETPSRQMVAEAMVLANRLAAQFLAEHDTPAIYRTQPEPREPIRHEEGKTLLELWQDRRKLSRVVMDLKPQPHWGLGLPQYTLATSPIRRYLDLVTHRQLLAAVTGTSLPYGPEDLEKIVAVIEPAMRRAGLLKTRRLRYWLLKYLAARVGQKKEALVLEAIPHRYRLVFPDLLLEVPLAAPATLKLAPGDTILVRLDKVLPREDQIKISLA
jgi:exoribonuclease-2